MDIFSNKYEVCVYISYFNETKENIKLVLKFIF